MTISMSQEASPPAEPTADSPAAEDRGTLVGAQYKPCISCGHDLKPAARICSECKEYQQKWRNEFKYWAGAASLIALIGSGIVFSVSVAKSGVDYQYPARPIVSEMNTFGNLSVVNVSAQSLWLRSLIVKSSHPEHDLRWDLGVVVKPRELLDVPLINLSAAQFAGLSSDLFGKRHGTYATRLPEQTRKEILANQHRNRFTPVFLLKGGTEHKQAEGYLDPKTLVLVECTASIQVMFADSQRGETVNIPCVGFIKNRIDPKDGD